MNKLTNPSFESGHHHQDGIGEIVVPDGWRLHWLDGVGFPGCGSPPAYRPESVVWNIAGAPAHERGEFFLDGNFCWKVFKAHAPVYFAITQAVSVTPGAPCEFVAPVYPDIVQRYENGHKVRPSDLWAAEARLGWSAVGEQWPASGDGNIHWTPWFNAPGNALTFGAYNRLRLDFTPDAAEVRVWVECKAKWGLGNNWFFDAFKLTQSGQPEPPQPPDPPDPPQPPPGEWRINVSRPAPVVLEEVAAAMRALAVVRFVDNNAPPPPPPPHWEPRRYIQRGTSIGFHSIGDYGLEARYNAAQATPPTIKFLNTLADLDTWPGVLRVGRLTHVNGQPMEGFDPAGDPEAQAEARMAALLPHYKPRAADDVWFEIMNEHKVETAGDPALDAIRAAKFARFWIRAVEIADAEGVRLAAFSFAAGQPEPATWDVIAAAGVFEALAAGGHAIALHGGGHLEGPEVPYVFKRHERLYNDYILPRHLDIPLFFTEFAPWILGQADQPCFDALGYLIEADDYLRTLPYLAGAQLFTWAGSGEWPEYTGLWEPRLSDILAWTRSVAGRQNG